ncbi:AFG1-like ATPase isoform X1 [Senna tora]|uniref:AFG1-like ATPase isoform X1 n=1 Tax=Senna tora TaxID=362788 RepID=A0A834SN09_9FABA|nr:AFG1-like ATPase isoform X1 [Senna tora]
MRIVVRSLRQLRQALHRPKSVWPSCRAEARNHVRKGYHSSAYRLSNHVATNLLGYHTFTTSRGLSVGAAKLINGVTEINRGGPLVEYERRIASGELVDGDNCQIVTLRELQRLYDELVENADSCLLDRSMASDKPEWVAVVSFFVTTFIFTCKGFISIWWSGDRENYADGSVFRSIKHKGVSDPLEVVAGEISEEAILLCLDEFMVTDVADALILNRLFRHLFSEGIILVATSNRAPDNLYEGGLQRDLFLPFIATLKERCVAHEIGSSTDYRKLTSGQQGFYLVGRELSGFLRQKFQQLVGERTPTPQEVEVVMGRKLQVPLGANGCAYFTFEELCDRPLGAADYFGLFKKFHTLALEGIPIFGLHNKTTAYRFVTLIDVIYENRARLLCTADGSPIELFERIVTISEAKQRAPRTSSRSRKSDDSNLCVDNELGFAKDRTISRLTEINSREYLEQHAAMLAEKQQQGVDKQEVLDA